MPPRPRPARPGPVAPGPLLAVAGLLIASLSAMCGIGGGIFAVPVLHYLFGVALRRAVATALCLVWAVALSATVSEALHPDGTLYWSVIGVLVVTSLVGAQIGFHVARRLRTRALKAIFCVALLAVGARVMVVSGGSAPKPDPDLTLGLAETALVAGIGVFAGVAVPLLGVGGGLIVVPALLLGLPAVGWYGARATSLAVAVASSTRSLWLYHGTGEVDFRTGGWFGLGASVGAVLGVQLVHRPGAGAVGQVLLGVVLVLAAARFGWDVAKDRGGGGGRGQAAQA